MAFSLGFVNQVEAQVKAEHQKIISIADSIFDIGDYINAKAYYQYILRLYPENQSAKTRLDESINFIKAEREQRIIYSDFIIAADESYKDKMLDEAIEAYQKAIDLFSFEIYPNSQIKKIENEIEQHKIIRAEYESVIKIADAYFTETAYKNAKIEYQFAISLLPDKSYPKNKLVELNQLIADEAFMLDIYAKTILKADSLFSQQNYKLASESYKRAGNLQPKEEYPQSQISKINLLLNPLEAYNNLLERADNYYLVKDFSNAKILYNSAMQTKPTDTYPAEMLAKVEQAIANKATSDEEDYQNAISQGDLYFSKGEFMEAQHQYEFASRIKPVEDYSSQKLNELTGILDSIKKSELLNEQYTELINKADILFSANEYKKAETIYQQAIDIKSGDSYPLEKLREIKNTLKALDDQKNLEANYSKSITKAEDFLIKENYNSAKSEFEYALRLKNEEPYPKSKIIEIDSMLVQIETLRSAEENYTNTIQQADKLFQQQKYGNAQLAYKKALNYKPDAAYPNTRLSEITNIFAEQQAELDRAYELAISNAKNEIAKNQLQLAKIFLNEALSLKPEESYPAITILQIDTQIAESKARALLQYEPLLKEADEYFKQKAYDRSLSFYYQASALLPNEIYPVTRIKEIIQIVNDANTEIILNTSVQLENNELKQYDFEPIPIADRRSNYFLLSLKNIDDARNFKIIFNYGNGQQKNGGLIIRLNKTSDSNYYLIRIGSLYKWFGEDNNWISIQPEGGRLEISEISISKIN